jgi:murein hydrolase activator
VQIKLIFTIACLVCCAALSAAQPPRTAAQHTLDSLRQELDQIDRQLTAGHARERDILKDIDARERRLSLMDGLVRAQQMVVSGLRDSISTLENQILLQEGSLAQVGTRILSIEDEQKQLTSSLARSLLAEHRLRGWGTLELLLSAHSWTDFFSRRALILRMQGAQEYALRSMQGSLSELQSSESNLFTTTQSLRERRAALQSSRIETQLAAHSLQTDLGQLNRERKTLQAKLGSVRNDRQLLAGRRREVSAAQAQIEDMVQSLTRTVPLTGVPLGSLKGSLPWPMIGRVVQQFGLVRNRELATVTENPGIELAAVSSHNVISVADGEVSSVTWLRGFGNVCIIEHPGSFYTVYAKLGQVIVHARDKVSAGAVLGYPSFDASSEEYRMHFELWSGKEKKNPQEWLQPR